MSSIGSISGILLGKYLIFQEGESMASQLAGMDAVQAAAYKMEMLQHTLEPYHAMIYVLLAIFALFAITAYPKCKVKSTSKEGIPSMGRTIIVMSIVGGAFVPAIQGYVSDVTGSMQLSFIINVLCFAFIGWYFHKEHKLETEEEELVVANHSA